MDGASEPLLSVIEIAKVGINVVKAYCESCGDQSMVDWDKASDEQKDGAVNNVMLFTAYPGIFPDDGYYDWLLGLSENGVSQKTKDFLFKAVCIELLAINASHTAGASE